MIICEWPQEVSLLSSSKVLTASHAGSDPRAGTPPSVIDHTEILRSVSLYYLSRSFSSSVFIYFQNPDSFGTSYTKAATDAPLLFSAFRYNVGFWPPAVVERVGNLVLYRSKWQYLAVSSFNLLPLHWSGETHALSADHDFGGHFPGIDNPPAVIDDLREIGSYWK